ncbi:hypothetical protein KH5H1_41270 [Corallococcus caeni]|uniref:hypothetical protein n=1 Tax=Corallococcus caeni TaxID=3082388 RepID=UPI002956727E|nr:hypothetical protein KH5H1_41270 [Corallococcus sp. KH5-1]
MNKNWTWPTQDLEGLVSGLELLDPTLSQEQRDSWWQTFLPGFSRGDAVRHSLFALAETFLVKIALKAEVHYSRQQGGSFFLVSEPWVPVLRFDAISPPPPNILDGMVWKRGVHDSPGWCAIFPESMEWTFVEEHDGPFFLRSCMDPPLGDSP